ncbi:MAG: YkgJ family cysteine cluster protein [Promethearchaeia archaeon]
MTINICEDCGICCKNTEMLISLEDIDSIIENSQRIIKKEDFVLVNDDGLYQLKNKDGYCVFFNKSTKSCNIYDYRPEGCRFYPLIYDFNRNNCILDKDCPRADLFYDNKKDLKKDCKKLKNFLKKKLFIDEIMK